MAAKFLNGLLTELEQCRFQFGRKQSAHVIKLLAALSARDFPDAASLIRFHEALLFLRAFPHGPSVLRRSENLLRSFCKRVDRLRQAGADMSEFDPLEVSGIAGTRMADVLSFDVAQWLAKRIPGKVEIDWKEFDEEWAWAAAWPRLMPLLEEDAYVEANIPWRRWLQAAQGSKSASPAWLLRRFASLPVSDREKTELYDSMRVPLRWELANLPLSRTRNYRTVPRVFYHQDRLLRRNEVSLTQELSRRPPALVSVSPARGAAILNMVREVMLVRYRELYGTTLGDPASVRHAEVGRGVSILSLIHI